MKPRSITEGKRNIVHGLLQAYDIKSATDLLNALKDLLGNTLKGMLLQGGSSLKKEYAFDFFDAFRQYRSAIMGVAALAILIFHVWIPIVPGHKIMGYIEIRIKSWGFVGVDVFFLLSGFGLPYSLKKSSLKSYYRKRAERLFIPYYSITAIKAVSDNWTFDKWLSRSLFIDFFQHYVYSYMWFVPALLILYALYPFLHNMMNKLKNDAVVVGVGIALWFIGTQMLTGIVPLSVFSVTNRLPVFLTGVYLGRLSQRKALLLNRFHVLLMLVLFLLGLHLLNLTGRGVRIGVPDSASAVPAYLISVSSVVLLTVLFKFGDALSCSVASKCMHCLIGFLSIVGSCSFELYCAQEWPNMLVYNYLEGHISYLGINCVNICVLIAFAYLLNRLRIRICQCLSYRKRP